MNQAEALEISRQAVVTMLFVAGPLMGIALVVGLTVSIFQSVTHLQEVTLTFVPKILAVFACTIFLMPYMLGHMTALMETIIDLMIGLSTR